MLDTGSGWNVQEHQDYFGDSIMAHDAMVWPGKTFRPESELPEFELTSNMLGKVHP
jgi:hypothetical protein